MSTEPARSRDRWDAIGFWLYGLHLWTLFGLALSNIFQALSAVPAGRALARRRVSWRGMGGALAPLGFYTLFLAASIAASYEPRVSLGHAKTLLIGAALVLALILVRGEAQVRRIVDGLIIFGGLSAGHGLIELFRGGEWGVFRPDGPFSHYMTFAGVLLIIDLLLVAQMACGRAWKSWWRWLALVAINLALIASLTRGAWVALAITVTVLLLMRAPRFIVAYIPATVIFLVLAPPPLLERARSIVSLQHPTNYDRLCMADAGLHMVRERPLFGLGPGMVEARYPIYRHPTAPRFDVPHLHNSFLQIAAEQGLLALSAYLWLMIAALLAAFRGYRRELLTGGSRVDLYMGVFLALLAFNLAGFFEDNWRDTEVQRLALFAVAAPYCLRRGETDGDDASDEAPGSGG